MNDLLVQQLDRSPRQYKVVVTKIPKVIKEDYDDNVLEEPVVGVELPDLFLQLLHHPLQLHHLSLFNDVADHGGV